MDREKALNWWYKLPEVHKIEFFKQYFIIPNKFTPAKNCNQLTGREVEYIWSNFSNGGHG